MPFLSTKPARPFTETRARPSEKSETSDQVGLMIVVPRVSMKPHLPETRTAASPSLKACAASYVAGNAGLPWVSTKRYRAGFAFGEAAAGTAKDSDSARTMAGVNVVMV